MCGICGIHNFRSLAPVDPAVLARMNATIVHRGPDGEGSFVEGELGMAMRRLSIIDVAGGAQPIWNESRTMAVVCNGEIYNYKQVRDTLRQRGHVFTTDSDVECIVHAYEEDGADCVSRLHGMFAFAVWDGPARRLLLGRDRLGIKPLFYSLTPDGVVFGSEIKALLAAGVPRRLDAVGLDGYFSHSCIPSPWTIFRDIRRLPPGHVMTCDASGERISEYWDLRFERSAERREDEYVEELRHRLHEAVRSHLQSDVPVGAFLSGGLDSGAVVAEMSRLTSPVRTFTIGFAHQSYDERPEAESVAARFGTTHVSEDVSVDWPTIVNDFTRWFDEPFGDYAAIPGFLAARSARRHVTVALSGDGGDEMLAGYPTHYAHRVARLYRLVPEPVRRHLVAPLVKALPTSMDRVSFDYRAKRFVDGAEQPFGAAHFHWKVLFTDEQKDALYSPAFRCATRGSDAGYAVYERLFARVAGEDPLSQLLYVDAKVFLLDDNLTRVDRTSMANSLEVRVPLLDDNLVDFVRRVPSHVKQRGFGTKRLLRQAMRGVLPDAVVRGEKKGFTPPMPYWLRGDAKSLLLDTLSPSRLDAIGLVDSRAVSAMIDAHLAGRSDYNRQLWSLLAFAAWWHEYRPDTPNA
jgi:asparagine synthase (glutamine-hydrolysing)